MGINWRSKSPETVMLEYFGPERGRGTTGDGRSFGRFGGDCLVGLAHGSCLQADQDCGIHRLRELAARPMQLLSVGCARTGTGQKRIV